MARFYNMRDVQRATEVACTPAAVMALSKTREKHLSLTPDLRVIGT